MGATSDAMDALMCTVRGSLRPAAAAGSREAGARQKRAPARQHGSLAHMRGSDSASITAANMKPYDVLAEEEDENTLMCAPGCLNFIAKLPITHVFLVPVRRRVLAVRMRQGSRWPPFDVMRMHRGAGCSTGTHALGKRHNSKMRLSSLQAAVAPCWRCACARGLAGRLLM